MFSHLKVFVSKIEYLATGSGFFLLGFLFGNWATLIPYIKDYFALSDATLGLLLLCLPFGAMSFNPFAAKLIQKFGLKVMVRFGMLYIPFAYFFPFLVSSLYLLPFTLIMVGVSMTILNISINMMATTLEKKYSQLIMATCHGLFSIGLMIGSLMRSVTLLFEVSEVIHMMCMAIIALILVAWAVQKVMRFPIETESTLKQKSDVDHKTKFSLPHGILLYIVLVSICINFTEGSMTDWASVYMDDVVKTSKYFIGWGLFGYSFFMALGRLFGDGIIPVLGRNKVLSYGAMLTFIGIFIVIAFPTTFLSILGFGLVGLGVSCGAPILYSSATRIKGMTGEKGLATMNFYAMGGFLGGPVIIGFISDLSNLSMAFGSVMILATIWFVIGSKVDLP